jgi:hypothetical protein
MRSVELVEKGEKDYTIKAYYLIIGRDSPYHKRKLREEFLNESSHYAKPNT